MAQQVGLSNSTTYWYKKDSLLQDLASFSVVVAGEYNSGKSTLINALTGAKLLETGTLPTTDTITVITHDNSSNSDGEGDDDAAATVKKQLQAMPGIRHHSIHLPLLQDLTLVDTPGTNAVLRDHTATTLALLPNADLILFVTAADRPFSESERNLLQSICHYRKSIVVIVNKMDVLDHAGGLHGSTEKQRVVDFVTEHASELLGARPIVIPISSRDALAAKLTYQNNNSANSNSSSSSSWQRSNFAALESFLRDSLTTETKIKAKLSSPVGVAEGLLEECRERVAAQRQDLDADVATLNLLQGQFAAWRRDVEAELNEAARDLRARTLQESERGAILLRRMGLWEFYSATTLATLFGTSKNNHTQKLQSAWNKTKPTFAPPSTTVQSELLEMVKATAETVATRGRAQGQTVIEFLGQRPVLKNAKGSSLVGSVTAASRFEDTRQQLAQHLQQAVHRHTDDWDERAAEESLLTALQRTAWVSAGLNAGAVGTILAAITTSAVDVVSAVAGASALAASSALVMTAGRQQLVKRYSDQWTGRGASLHEDVEAITGQQVEILGRRIRDGVAPYTRFVEAEQERLERLAEQCEQLTVKAQRLRQRIRDL